ncbi:hypothetical protein B0E53_07016 [Micromonospora sp. MH33]|nr:hypothetical protein B0E53_07016 [Micromonospora sp. MH33]
MPEQQRQRRHAEPAECGGDGGRPGLPARVEGPGEHREQAVAEQAGGEAHDARRGRAGVPGVEEEVPDRYGRARQRGGPEQAEQHHPTDRRGERLPVGPFVAGRPGRHQRRVRGHRERHGQHRPGQEVDRLGQVVDTDVGGPAVGDLVERDDQGDLLGGDGDHTGHGQPTDPGPGVGGEPETGARPQPEPAQRDEQGERQHHHAERGAAGEQQFAAAADLGDPGQPPLDGGEAEVDRDHGDAGQQRGDHRPGEPPVRLEHAGEHDADAVERQLGGEDAQHPRPGLLLDAVQAVAEQPHQRVGEQRHQQRERHQQAERPGEQRPGGGGHRPPLPRLDRAGQQRYDEAGQRPTGDDLEDEVRDVVGHQVRATEVGGGERPGEDGGAAEAGQPADHGEYGDEGGRPGHTAGAGEGCRFRHVSRRAGPARRGAAAPGSAGSPG